MSDFKILIKHLSKEEIEVRDELEYDYIFRDEIPPVKSWLEKFRTNPPEWMRHSADSEELIMKNSRTYAMWWIGEIVTNPPEWMRHDPNLIDSSGNTCAMRWINRTKTAPPEWMWHNPIIQEHNTKWTSAMLYISFCHSNPPEWMWHVTSEGCYPELAGDYKNTCAMLWIQCCETNPPEWMWHNPNVQNENGETCAMIWIQYCKTNPPEWMWHDPGMRNPESTISQSFTCVDLWMRYVLEYGHADILTNEVPKWMRLETVFKSGISTTAMKYARYNIPISDNLQHEPHIQNKNGETCAMVLIREYKTNDFSVPNIPEWMWHDPELTDNWGNTCAMIWLTKINDDVPQWMWHITSEKCFPEKQNDSYKTCAMIYIEKYKREPPEWMWHDRDIQNIIKGETCIDLYFKHCEITDKDTWCGSKIDKKVSKNELNEFNPNSKDENGDTQVMIWIKTCGPKSQDITERKIPFDRTVRDNDGNTCAMLWIIHRKSVPPVWMRHDVMLENNDGKTCSMLWVENNKKDSTVPHSIRIYNPNWQNKNGDTCAMHYIREKRAYPPRYMLSFTHEYGTYLKDPMIKNNKGETYFILWLKYGSGEMRKFIYHDYYDILKRFSSGKVDKNGMSEAAHYIIHKKELPKPFLLEKTSPVHQDNSGKTCAMHWVHYVNTKVPEVLMHSDRIKDNCGFSLGDYIKIMK